LRGCGLPNEHIEFLCSSLGKAHKFYSCFISYSHDDTAFVEQLYNDLKNNEVQCWYAMEDLKIGDRFQDRIEESIKTNDKLLLVLSQASIRSPWVEDEVQAGLERERKEHRLILFPVSLDDDVMQTQVPWAARFRRTRHIGDFSRWKDPDAYRKAFGRLLKDLKPGDSAAGSPE